MHSFMIFNYCTCANIKTVMWAEEKSSDWPRLERSIRCEYITVSYKTVTLQNGTCYKTVHVTKRYVLQNGTRYKTVHITKR